MLILNKFYFNTFLFFFIFVRINQKITINLTTIKIKKLLFTASLLLAFNLSSFANTNGTKIAIVKETKVENVTEYNEEDDCRTITYRWTEVICDGPVDDPNSYTIYFNKITISICDDPVL